MRRIKTLLTCTILLLNTYIVEAKDEVSNQIQQWMAQNQVPGISVQVYDHGQARAYYFGMADRATQKPINKNTIFEIGSFTKLFTGLLLAQQVQLHKATLSDPLSKTLPDLTHHELQHLTLENLATHTGGLPFTTPKDVTNRPQLQQYFDDWQPVTSVGTHWRYSNMSIGLLGYALEAITHHNMNQMYRNNILLPLGMNSIGLIVPKKWLANYAQGYNAHNNPIPATKLSLFPAAGQMKMSAHDSQLFLKAALGLSNNKNITAAMQLTQTAYYNVDDWQQGLGWEIHCTPMQNKTNLLQPSVEMNQGPLLAKPLPISKQQFNSTCLIDKTGATKGFRSYIVLLPNEKTGVVILTNRYVSNGTIVKLGREILFKLLAQ